jgi:hypothetical protein
MVVVGGQSKECYSSGLADLAQGLANWKASKNGARQGRHVGFPRFKSARRDAGRSTAGSPTATSWSPPSSTERMRYSSPISPKS